MDPNTHEVGALAQTNTSTAGASAPGGNNTATQEAHNSAEAMAEYLDCLEKIGTVEDISVKLSTYVHVLQISHKEMGEYYGALEVHIIPFLGKYGYQELKQAISASYNRFVDEVSYRINDPTGDDQMVLRTYYELLSVIGRILSRIVKDFGGVAIAEGVAGSDKTEDGGGVGDDGGEEEGGVGEKDVEGAGDDTEGKKKENVDTLGFAKLSLDPTPAIKKNED
ncbi:hypothetical protein TWF506_008033 [Arthrobotrys conoides]|uniref:Uncharacterized protein n=1 Tax=Arthrobotrys conoides TaxID=74498 RepID=A0AAN8N8Q4_9PEZI